MFTPMMPIGTAEPSGASEGSRDKAAGRLRHLREAILHRWFVATLVCLLSVAVLMLVWIGHRAFEGWQRSAALLAERRAQEKAMLLSVALDRDMKAVQASVLVRFGGRRLAFKDPYELFDFLITQQEVNHIFDNYRRNRATFSVRTASNRAGNQRCAEFYPD